MNKNILLIIGITLINSLCLAQSNLVYSKKKMVDVERYTKKIKTKTTGNYTLTTTPSKYNVSFSSLVKGNDTIIYLNVYYNHEKALKLRDGLFISFNNGMGILLYEAQVKVDPTPNGKFKYSTSVELNNELIRIISTETIEMFQLMGWYKDLYKVDAMKVRNFLRFITNQPLLER